MTAHRARSAFGFSVLAFAAAAWLAGSSAHSAPPPSATESITFEKHVRPIFKAHCFHCHGEDGELEAGLDVRLVRLLTTGGDSGAAVVPGKHVESLLFQRVTTKEMPPGEKKLSPTELSVLARWIDQGAKTAKPEPAAVAEITDEDRAFWSFQPIRKSPIPKVTQAAAVRTPVDAFLLHELENRKLKFSAEAEPEILVRRLYFDLLGLPPTPAEIEEFVSAYTSANGGRKPTTNTTKQTGSQNSSVDPYEALVDKLLASPHYGERWGRHWLDVAGYADSDGYTPLDSERRHMYKYRDYVIRSLNEDKPWNEFIVEQLAGDELIAPPYAGKSPPEIEKLIATGFLRCGPDGTADSSTDQPTARNDVVAETIKIVSTSLLGLSVGCAQCHSHRYDPITQTDYYAFRALFEPAYDPQKWRSPQARLVSLLTPDQKKQVAAIDAELKKIAADRLAELVVLQDEVAERVIAKLPEEIREPIRTARKTPVAKQTPAQKKLLKDHPNVNITATGVRQESKDAYAAWEKKYDELTAKAAAKRPAEEFIHCLTEVPGQVSTTRLFYRGDHMQPREEVRPAELSIVAHYAKQQLPVDDPSLPTTGRRLAYARHLTHGDHPLVARVLVNRFWMHHFGRGIVGTPGDFGFLGERPTHPELLDWLAADFMDGGWKLKRLHKQILLSNAYRQSSSRTEKLDAVDPDNVWLGRMSVRRLEAETLRDSVLAVAGNLNRKQFGPPVPVTPDETGQTVLGIDTREGAGRFTKPIGSVGDEAFRRSLYIQARRTLPLGMLETFDAPQMEPNCECRASSTVTPQSLLLMNNVFIIAESLEFARRLQREAGADLAAQVRLGWHSAYGRRPTDEQVREACDFIALQTEVFNTTKTAAATGAPTPASPAVAADATDSKITPEQRALASFCQSLLCSNGFLYVD